jgi:hypothetical protein
MQNGMMENRDDVRRRMNAGINPSRRGIDDAPNVALGLRTRGQAIAVFVLGLFTPYFIGVPLIIWGVLAEWMMMQERKRRAKK